MQKLKDLFNGLLQKKEKAPIYHTGGIYKGPEINIINDFVMPLKVTDKMIGNINDHLNAKLFSALGVPSDALNKKGNNTMQKLKAIKLDTRDELIEAMQAAEYFGLKYDGGMNINHEVKPNHYSNRYYINLYKQDLENKIIQKEYNYKSIVTASINAMKLQLDYSVIVNEKFVEERYNYMNERPYIRERKYIITIFLGGDDHKEDGPDDDKKKDKDKEPHKPDEKKPAGPGETKEYDHKGGLTNSKLFACDIENAEISNLNMNAQRLVNEPVYIKDLQTIPGAPFNTMPGYTPHAAAGHFPEITPTNIKIAAKRLEDEIKKGIIDNKRRLEDLKERDKK